MRILLAALTLLTLAGCGSGSGSTATDPAGAAPTSMPTSVPPAEGRVRTRGATIVMDTGRPELCLGPVAESYPPQCGGPPLADWSWRDHEGAFEQQGDVRWGMFAVTGAFDGTTLTVVTAVPATSHDPVATPHPDGSQVDPPLSDEELSEQELADVADVVGRLPGAQGAHVAGRQVRVDVTHDDGSLQAWADREYGEGVVVVTSALVPVP